MSEVLPFQAGKRVEDVTLLARSSFLAHVGMRDLGALLDALDQLALPAGATIFRQGEDGEHMYVVLDGEVRLTRGSLDVSRLGPGDHFGETAILGIPRRATTASAHSPVRLARLSRVRFLSLSVNHPRVALHVTEALAASLAASVTAMTDDVGLLLRQRTLPRREHVRILVDGVVIDAPMGALAGSLLPDVSGGYPVVAASLDHKLVSLETAVTSDATLAPITVATAEGRRIYRSSVGLLFLEASRRVDAGKRASLGPRRGDAQVVEFDGGVTAEELTAIEGSMRELVAAATPMREEIWAVDEARARFLEQGWDDAATLVPFHRDKTISLVVCGATFALGLGPVVPSAKELGGFTLSRRSEEVVLDFGEALRRETPVMASGALVLERSFSNEMTRQLGSWLRALGVSSVGHFDRACVAGQVGELIRVSEGFHEKNIGKIADRIAADGRRIVAIAGPSSSGKTTFIRRLEVQLEVNGITPVRISLDDYYVDRDLTPRDEDGDYDFEAAGALHLDLLREHVGRLLAGERVRTARYDFRAGRSVPLGGDELVLGANDVLLVEGLHAFAPELFGALVADAETYRIFVHPAAALPFDRLSSVLPEDVRLLRRIVRDRHRRGYAASESIRRWPSVRRGEERHVFAHRGRADFVFDTSLVYELAVLRIYAERYLLEVGEEDAAYETACRLRQLIDRFVPIHPDHVPPTSILREFIGGSGFDELPALGAHATPRAR